MIKLTLLELKELIYSKEEELRKQGYSEIDINCMCVNLNIHDKTLKLAF